jgi:broad specificity phosphatase PhoE
MVVYLMRHSESEWNVDSSSTRKDPPITQNGMIQASKLEFEVDVVFCSPLRRARETLESSKIRCRGQENVWHWDVLREVRSDPCDFFESEEFSVEDMKSVGKRVDMLMEKMKEVAKEKESEIVLFVGHSDLFYHLSGYDLDLCEVIQFDPFSGKIKMIHWSK